MNAITTTSPKSYLNGNLDNVEPAVVATYQKMISRAQFHIEDANATDHDGNELSPCWITGFRTTPRGYSLVAVTGMRSQRVERYVHQISYAVAHDVAISDMSAWYVTEAKYTVDHLCRNKACCNPEHLELVPLRENLNRISAEVRSARSETCRRDHRVDGANAYSYNGYDKCRLCGLANSRKTRLGISIEEALDYFQASANRNHIAIVNAAYGF